MTKIETFNEIKKQLTDNALIEFIDHEIELLQKKKSSTKQTAKQQENEMLKGVIQTFLEEEEKAFTISEMQENVFELQDLSNQRISAILKQMVDENMIQKEYVKRKAYFSAIVE